MLQLFSLIWQPITFWMSSSEDYSKANSSEDLILVEAAKKNPDAFEALYNKYFYKIYSYLHSRTRDKYLTDELTSDTFYKAFVHLNKFKNQGFPFSSWLYKIASNELMMYYRRHKKAIHHLDIQTTALEVLLEEKIDVSNEEKLERLSELISSLSFEHIQLIQWRFFEDKSFKEIGMFLSITEANAKVKTYRVLERLKHKWKNKYNE
jgi:RNA polymerase sigma-70 factor (ECF subfamily)